MGKRDLKFNQNYKMSIQQQYLNVACKKFGFNIWKQRKLMIWLALVDPENYQKHERIIKIISSANNKLSMPQVCTEFISGCSATISASAVRRILKKYMVYVVAEASGNLSWQLRKDEREWFGPTSIRHGILANGKMLFSVMKASSSLTVLIGNIGCYVQ